MSKAYIFPGQGSQFPGMGKDLYMSSAKAHDLFELANVTLDFGLTAIMFNGSAEDLKATRVTQPAVFLHSTALALCAVSSGRVPRPDMVAGHSLGEFSALTVAGAMSFEDALRLVSIRATQMQLCCEKTPGAMAAVISLSDELVEKVCEETPGVVVAANYNCNGQVVISGELAAVEAACVKMKQAGARRALVLPVGGAFHSPLMEPARAELAKAIDQTPFKAPYCPVYQNVTAKAETDPQRIKDNLLAQLTSPVRWTQSVRQMASDGADSFIEFGPGSVLQGLVKKIVPSDSGIEIGGYVF